MIQPQASVYPSLLHETSRTRQRPRALDTVGWNRTELYSIGYSVSKEAGVGQSKDMGDKGVGSQSKQGRKMQRDYNKEGCGGQTQTHYSIRQKGKAETD